MTDISIPAGVVAITTYGQLQTETAFCLLEARSHAEKQGLNHVDYIQVHGALVDKARNAVFRQMLASQAQWVLMVDGDMIFPKDAILKILATAYGTHPHFDVVGGYCTLRGGNHLPTVDSGTGTWESHYPGNGPIQVMRTGGAFLLVKRHVAERIPDPWFALRIPKRALDAIAEVDTFCRTKFDGRNPFAGLPNQPWERMVSCAVQDTAPGPWIPAEVGEDSSFCDRVTGAGMRIAVDTNVEIMHLSREAHGWQDHRKSMDEQVLQHRLMSGLLA